MSKVIEARHGNGGRMTHELISNMFHRILPMANGSDNDSCPIHTSTDGLVVTTDGHAIDPIIFPGGNIGKLSVTGTINDLLALGAKPLGISAGFILQEGLPLDTLETILQSMAKELKDHDMNFYSGDTKVIQTIEEPGLFITTTGFGTRIGSSLIGPSYVKAGMDIICTGPIGSHGVTILGHRNQFEMTSELQSDVQSLFFMMADLFKEGDLISCFRDATRGGILSVMYEICQNRSLQAVLKETRLPIENGVKSSCDLLGLEILEVANEGVGIIFCEKKNTPYILKHLHNFKEGRKAECIGELVDGSGRAKVILETAIGGQRAMAWTNADNLPRIC
ncbi:MAG: hydrogenase expression/formation protein HypE [Bacteriovoracaceae bacterium]|nr:hydrogenase expression/formation protein HypE [Bacteriovoracaceae bacterium]